MPRPIAAPTAAPISITIFEPALYALEELRFLLEHLEESPTVALHGTLPPFVQPVVVRQTLGTFVELEDLERARGVKWAGYDRVRDSIERFLDWHDRSLEIFDQGGPRHPSQHTWDSRGNLFAGGVGADANALVKSEITDDGERKPFTVDLRRPVRDDAKQGMPWLKRQVKADPDLDVIAHNETQHTLTCSVCDHTIAYKGGSKANYNLARGQMMRHLKIAKSETDRHRQLFVRESR